MAEASGVLGEIVERKKVDVAARLAGLSLDDLRLRATPTGRSLHAALARPGARFIMEVKRASPSQGMLKEAADPASVAKSYTGAADAISVLTDTPYFGGSFADLDAVRAVFDGPILCKDFMIDPRQVAEARLHGADAILVMLSVLDDAEARTMIEEAARFSMDVLVEAHDEDEVRRAVAIGAPIIGINNRDLRTLTVDLAVTERLAGLVPADRILVSESGVESRADVQRLAPKADAFLVGSALMRASDPREAARTLAYGRVKICGLTNEDDVRLAAALGATHAGFILVPGTPRAVTASDANRLAAAARGEGLKTIGVFRDAEPSAILAAAEAAGFDAVQLHGDEGAASIAALRAVLPAQVEIWTSAAVEDGRVDARSGGDRILFDTKANGRSGGTGQAFDWSLLKDRDDLPHSIIAGGINPDNAGAAASLGAYAIDLSSGVERSPGKKCKDKMISLFDGLRVPTRGESRC